MRRCELPVIARPKRKHSGRGLAIAQWLPLGGECHALVAVDAQGNVTVSTAMLDQGAGTHTAMRLVAAEELKIPLEKVRVATLDTSEVGTDTGIGASRGTRIFGNATRLAAVHAKDQLIDAASEELGVAKDALATAAATAPCAPLSGARVSYGDIARMNGGSRSRSWLLQEFRVRAGSGAVRPGCRSRGRSGNRPGGAQTIHQRAQHRHGAQSAHASRPDRRRRGHGHGLRAHGRGDDRRRQSRYAANFGDSKIPSIRDIPVLKTVIQEFPVGNGPYGGMSIGEPPVVPTAPAIANAVQDAVGVRIYDLPITAEKVLRALRANGVMDAV